MHNPFGWGADSYSVVADPSLPGAVMSRNGLEKLKA
jgi:hypothetical protein